MTAVSDNFNRADSTNLGAAWTEVVGNWEIVSQKVQCNDDGGLTGYYARYETDVGSSDMFSQAVTSSTQANASSNTGLAVRMRSGANTSYQMTTRHAGDTIGCWRIVADTETQQSWQTEATAISTTINSGDTIRVEAVGSLIRGKVQGALVGICVNTAITDGQRAGLNGYNNVGTDVVELDDFSGGGLAADGGLQAPYIVGISGQVTGTATTLTPTVPSNVAAGDLVVVQATSRDAAQTMAAPAGEGWASQQSPSQTGLEDVVWAKVWGLGGQTDDTTPTFTIGAGTAGWGASVTVFRNPSHSTNPWTSVSAAVVASGSQANASSTTVTAPSVTHDGTNRTVVRIFSSADDNALNTPSSGALAYGAAGYDSVTGNDFAQAMSLREDITVTTNTGTSTVTETLVGPDVSNGVTLVLAVPTNVDGTATPAVIAATSTLPAATVTGVTQVQPAAIAGTSTLPAPTASGAATAGPSVVTAAATLPSPTAVGQTLVQPAVVAAATSLPAPGVSISAGPASTAATTTLPAPSLSGAATATPAAVDSSLTLPAASAGSPASTQPSVIAAPATLPAPTATGAATASPAVITTPTTFPAPASSGQASVQPSVIAVAATLPAPALGATVSPPAVAALIALPASTLDAHSNAQPAAITAPIALPAPSTAGAALAQLDAIQSFTAIAAPGLSTGTGPATIHGPLVLPAPSVSAGGSTSVSPATIHTAASVVAPSPAIGVGVDRIAAVASLPAPSVAGGTGANVTAPVIAALAAVPPAAPAGSAVTQPVTVQALTALPAPTVTSTPADEAPPNPIHGDYDEAGYDASFTDTGYHAAFSEAGYSGTFREAG